jgi:molybdate transport system substrate-binding protein
MFPRILLAISLLLAANVTFAGDRLTVSAAVSLKEPLTEIAKQFEHDSGISVALNLGASGQLAAQIDAGAPVDVFVSAGEAPIRMLTRNGKIGDSRLVAGNRVVLIVPAGKSDVSGFQSLSNNSVKRLAIGRPRVVPAGDYAVQVLDHLGLSASVKEKLVYGQNVRQVLDYVSRGEVDAGIVYATDAAEAKDSVRIVATANESTHDPVRYLAAVVKGAKQGDAVKFVDYLAGPVGQNSLRGAGFFIIPAGTSQPAGEK